MVVMVTRMNICFGVYISPIGCLFKKESATLALNVTVAMDTTKNM